MAAPVLAVNDIVQIRMAARQVGQNGMNVLTFRVSAVAGISLDLPTALAQWDLGASALMVPMLTAQASYYGSAIKIMSPTPSVEFSTTANTAVGTAAGDSAPKQSSLVVTKKTAFPGRAFRGRMYIPFPGDVATDASGSPAAAYVVLANNLASFLLLATTLTVGLNSVTLQPVIPHSTGAAPTDILGFVVQKKFGTQRRRGDYGKIEPAPW